MTLVINRAVGCHYFLPGPRLSSQLQSVVVLGQYQIIPLGEQRHVCERLAWWCSITAEWPQIEPASSRSLVQYHAYCATCRNNFVAGWNFINCLHCSMLLIGHHAQVFCFVMKCLSLPINSTAAKLMSIYKYSLPPITLHLTNPLTFIECYVTYCYLITSQVIAHLLIDQILFIDLAEPKWERIVFGCLEHYVLHLCSFLHCIYTTVCIIWM